VTSRKTDGERIAEKVFSGAPLYRYAPNGFTYPTVLAADIDRLVRRRMAEAWEDGWFSRDCQEADWDRNPYRGGRRKK